MNFVNISLFSLYYVVYYWYLYHMRNFQLHCVLGAGLNAFLLDPKISKRQFKYLISKNFVSFTAVKLFQCYKLTYKWTSLKLCHTMFHVLNRLKNIEVGHFTRRLKLPHSTLHVHSSLQSMASVMQWVNLGQIFCSWQSRLNYLAKNTHPSSLSFFIFASTSIANVSNEALSALAKQMRDYIIL